MVNQVTPRIGNLNAASGRIICEDDSIINIGDLLKNSINVNFSISNTRQYLAKDSGKTLFHADFAVGLDTLSTWNLVFGGSSSSYTLFAAEVDGDNQVGPADTTESIIPIFATSGLPFERRFVLESKVYMKFLQSADNFVYISGIFQDALNTEGTSTAIGIGLLQDGSETVIAQDDWNVDKMDGTGVSQLTLDFTKIQTLAIDITQRDSGVIIFGFVVDNVIYYAHKISVTNSQDSVPFGNLSVPLRVDATTEDGFVNYRFGVFNDLYGIYLRSSLDVTEQESDYTPMLYLMDCSIVAYGGVYNDFYRSFSAGNNGTLKTVTTELPILSIQAKEDLNSQINRTIFFLKKLQLAANGSDLTDGAFVKIVYGGTLTGASFSSVDDNSGLEFDTDASAISGGTVIDSFYVFPNTCKQLDFENTIENFMNRFSLFNIDAVTYDTSIISIVATAIDEAVDIGAQLNWGEVQ